MPKQKLILYAFIHAIAAAAYVALIAFLITNAEMWFGPAQGPLGVTAFLLTFVLSAAVMGITIFGRPIMWYLNGLKKEAIRLLIYTIGFLLFITLIVFLTIVLFY